MASVRDRLAAARTAAREDDRNGVKRQPGASIGQNESAGASPRPTAVNETAQSGNDAVDVRDRLASAKEQARKADSTAQTAVASKSPTAEKPDSARAAEQSNADRLAALREEKGRLEAGLDLDGAARVQEEITQLEKDMGIYFWQRVWNTVKGSTKSSAAGMADASRALYESGQNARTARDTDTMAEYKRSLERAKYDMSVMLEENTKAPGTWTDRDIQSQQNIIDGWQRKYDAMAKVSGEQVQQKATQATAQLADTVQESAQKDIEKAKEGLGAGGRLLVDAGVAGTQMLGDAAANLIMPGGSLLSMAYRGFGSGTQQARLNGATLAQQIGYGAAAAGVEVISEKLFDGLAGIYGGGAADDIIEGVIRKMAKTENGQLALRVLSSGANEALEEVISGAISPALESIYDGKNPLSHYSMETVTDILHDAAVGGILGGIGGSVNVFKGRNNQAGTTGTAQEATQQAVGARMAQQETLDTAQVENAAEPSTDPLVQILFGQKKTAPETVEDDGHIYKEHHGNILDSVRSHIDEIKGMEPVSKLTGLEFQKTEADNRNLRTKVIEFFNSLGNKVYRPGFGDITLNTAGVRDSLSHGYGKIKAAAFASLPELLRDGKLIDYEPNYRERGYETFLFAAPVKFGQDTGYVGAYVIKDQKTQRYKLHEVLMVEKEDVSSFKTESVETDGGLRDNTSPSMVAQQEAYVNQVSGTGTVGAAAAGFTNSDYGNLQLDSSQFHSEGANAARPVDVPMYDGDGNPVSRFASNAMGAKAIPDDVIPMIQQMVADGELSYRSRKNKNVRRQAIASIREKGFGGAMEQLRTAVRDGKSDVDTVALGTELLVNAANAGDANATAEILSLMQASSTRAGQAMQYFTVLRKLSPSAQLYAIQKTVEQLNEKLDGRKNGKANGKRTSSKKKSGSANGKENIPVSEWMTKAGELLAERLEKSPEGQNGKAKTVVDTILIDLTRYAKDYMGRTESRGSERTYEQRLSDLMENLPQYTKAVESAKAHIAENYKNDPDMLAEFDEWMKNDIVSIFLSNESGKTVSVPKTLIEKFLSQTDQKGRDAVMEEIYQNVADQVPPTWKDRWDAWRYMSMLANPRTHIRNIGGNLGFQPIRVIKNELAAGMERLFNVEEKTKSFASSPAMYRAAWADYKNVGSLLSGNRYSDAKGEIERRRRSFDTKALEAASKWNSEKLDLEDAVFKRLTYADALAGYLTANGVKAEQLDGGTVPAELLSRARDYAASEALKATYQDDNAVSRKVQEVGKTLGVVGDALIPFKKTPANILVRGFEYSPAGLAKALTYDLAKVQRGEMSAAQAIDSVASGLTGTVLFSLGAYLFANGLLTGAKGDDKEDKWDELLGHQGYALELPDGTSITLDWMAPEALPLFMGAEFMSSVGEAGWTADEIVSALLDATKSVAEPIIEMSMLQGVNDLIESVKYADGSPLSAMIPSIITSYLSQAVPTVLGQIERTSEPVRMTTYTDKNSKMPTDLQYAIGRVSAKTPGLDYQQIPYIDAWGRTEESGDVLVRAVNNLFNPAYMSQVDVDNVESELQRLYDATGEGSVFPSRADKSFVVDKKEKYLSAEEYVKYAKELGQGRYSLVQSAIKSDAYKGMSDDEKAAFVTKMQEYANYKAKKSVAPEYENENFSKYAMAEKAGMSPAEYYVMRETYDYDASNSTGQPTQEEAQRYLDTETNLSRSQKADLWTIIKKSWDKNNPYA